MYQKYIKRLLDIFISCLLIIITFPILLIVIPINLIGLGFPIHNIIRNRIGKNGKIFLMYKIRTKKLGKEYVHDGSQFTKFSKFLELTRINEIPQFINVLKGDMSIVGPRPYIPNEGFDSKKYYLRHSVRPGLTGLSQIKGGRFISFERKEYYDNYYVKNISFLLDLKIFFLTPISLIKLYFKTTKNI